MLRQFVDFLKQYGIIGLAIAVILGGEISKFVGSVVNDLLTPVILQPALSAAGIENIAELSFHGILYGKVLSAAISFIVVAGIVFLFAKKVLKEETVAKK